MRPQEAGAGRGPEAGALRSPPENDPPPQPPGQPIAAGGPRVAAPGERGGPAGDRRRWWRSRWLPAAALAAALAIGWGWYWCGRRPLAPAGGLPLPWRLELPVPAFRQADPAWGRQPLGPTEGTLGAEGCAVAAAAMVLAYYGADVDPGRLNAFLLAAGGYTERGWIRWEAAAAVAPDRVRFCYEDLPSHFLIDTNLLRGNPLIVRLRYPNGVTHFMVIVGKRGFDYLVRDPGWGAAKGVYPLREFGSRIEALRFYARR